MSEFNVVLEGEYKGKKIKKGSFFEIITEGENSKISINKSNVQAYDILDETDKKTYSVWKGMWGNMIVPFLGWAAGIGGKKKEVYLVSINWRGGKKSLICIEKGWKEALIRGMF